MRRAQTAAASHQARRLAHAQRDFAEAPRLCRCCQRPAGGFGVPELLVHLCLRCGGDTQAELGGAGRAGRQAGVLGEVGALVQHEHEAAVEGEEGDGSVGAGDLVVELLADDAFGRPARPSR